MPTYKDTPQNRKLGRVGKHYEKGVRKTSSSSGGKYVKNLYVITSDPRAIKGALTSKRDAEDIRKRHFPESKIVLIKL